MLAGETYALHVSEQQSRNGDRTLLARFWFQTNAGSDATAFPHQQRLMRQALQQHRSYDLFVRLVTEIQPRESVADARERLDRFTRQVEPLIRDWVHTSELNDG